MDYQMTFAVLSHDRLTGPDLLAYDTKTPALADGQSTYII